MFPAASDTWTITLYRPTAAEHGIAQSLVHVPERFVPAVLYIEAEETVRPVGPVILKFADAIPTLSEAVTEIAWTVWHTSSVVGVVVAEATTGR
jgi:hypothetical protein